MNRDITFYEEWLELDKKEFRILAMLADQKEFKGTLNDICRYLNISTQSRNRNKIRESIQVLLDCRFINAKQDGRTWLMEVIPKDTEILVNHFLYERLLAHDYYTKSVSWEAILKVLMWLTKSGSNLHTDQEIAEAIKMSVDTVGDAKSVLENEFAAIVRNVSRRWDGEHWIRRGQYIDVKAWLDE